MTVSPTDPSSTDSSAAGSAERPLGDGSALDVARRSARRSQRLRLAAFGIVLVALFLVAWWLGLDEYLDRERIRTLVASMGAWGPIAFVVLFALGELIHVPAWAFVGAAVLVWGPFLGGALGFLGANVSVMFSFAVARAIGGKAFDMVERPFVRRLLARIDEEPILVVAALRVIFAALPALNYGLAFTRIRFVDYAVGSALGLLVSVTGMTLIAFFTLG